MAAARRGDIDAATEVVVDLVGEDWDNAEAHRAWGCVLLAKGKPSDAVGAFRAAVQIEPRRAELHFDLGTALLAEADQSPFLQLSNWIDAQEAITKGLTISPWSETGLELQKQLEAKRSQALI